jgi:nucleoside-diphosphate-sugar epimerase
MIIGNGLIATAFKCSGLNHNDLIIFASGVAKSKENRVDEYDREYTLLKKHINKHKLIYFSSCSIIANSDTEYSIHKRNIEEYIQTWCKDYLILRLPNIVGISNNKNQLLNYFYHSLVNQELVILNTDCVRHLVDVEDLPKIVQVLNEQKVKSEVINIAFDNGISVDKIVGILETVVGLKFKKIKKYQGGNDYSVDTTETKKYIKDTDQYNTIPENIIKKYYKKYEN